MSLRSLVAWLRCLVRKEQAIGPAVADPEEPSPVTQSPPASRFCDLVLTGGIASGVAYPWAIVELARHYRFRNLGGTSVGAVAAALAAASEYGRCMNVPNPFEVLRQVPLNLASPPEGRCCGEHPVPTHETALRPPTKMISLFQPTERGRRLFEVFVDVLTAASRSVNKQADPQPQRDKAPAVASESKPNEDFKSLIDAGVRPTTCRVWLDICWRAAKAYGIAAIVEMPIAPVMVLLAALSAVLCCGSLCRLIGLLLFVFALCCWAYAVVRVILQDFVEGVVKNGFGFCSGMGADGREGFTEWMHKGIQKAAGLAVDGSAPLTFRDLWNAPRPVAVIPADADRCLPEHRAINLEIVATNVTHGRPLRFPITDTTSRLYYHPEEWKGLFPQSVRDWLKDHSFPYSPASPSDPIPGDTSNSGGLRSLPIEDLPIVVAARMSMSFPGLFATIPVYAVDYESPRDAQRYLRRCRIADGGLCSNFPIHFFDKALPRWPTFGLWLSRRLRSYKGDPVWLPEGHLEGRGDNWLRFEPATTEDDPTKADAVPVSSIVFLKYLLGLVETMKDWGDRSTMLLPHVRNRVVRLALRAGEGQLHIAMPKSIILRMANQYGTLSGRRLCERYLDDGSGVRVRQQWQEHLYVRTQVLLTGLRQLLNGVSSASKETRYTVPIDDVLREASHCRPLHAVRAPAEDATGQSISVAQSMDLQACMQSLSDLEKQLKRALGGQPYRPQPTPDLRLRPPV